MKLLKVILVICIILGLLLVVLNLPFFTISDVEIYGNNRVSNDEVLETINYSQNTVNYFFLNKREAKRKILTNPYVREINFTYQYPSKMNIDIIEREQIAYVPYGKNSYLYISREGTVLQTANQLLEPLPIVRGVNFTEFTVGEKLVSEGTEILNGTVEIINTMKRYDIETKNLIIDINVINEIKIRYNDVIINFGKEEEIDKKVRVLYGILEALEEKKELRGKIDISNTNTEPILIIN